MTATTVLVVDDESGVRHLLRRWLVGWGYAVVTVSGATEALESMLARPAQIMLVDLQMPGHDGLWLMEHVHAKWPGTAVVVASGVNEMDMVKQAQSLGAVDYVTKPIGRDLLLQALDRAVRVLASS